MIDISRKLEDRSIRSLKKNIARFLSESNHLRNKSAVEDLTEELMEMFRLWLVSYDKWNPGNLISAETINRIKSIVDGYKDICADGYTKSFVLKSYNFERFGTSIDFTKQKMQRILGLKKELEQFFFISHVFAKDKSQNSLFASRFSNYDKDPLVQFKEQCGVFDRHADKAGMMFDYLSKEVAWYCIKNRPELIK